MSKKSYKTDIVDKHTDCKVGMCSHFDCNYKTADGCKLVNIKK